MKKVISGILVLLICFGILVGITSCGAADKYSDNSASDSMPETAARQEFKSESKKSMDYGAGSKMDNTGEAQEQVSEERKIIVRETIDIQTVEFEKDKQNIIDKMEEVGGYLERSEVSGKGIGESYSRRYANLSIRIPKEKYEVFKQGIEKFAHITNQYLDTSDVTLEFYDTEARVKTLEIQEERLMEILKKAEDIKVVLEVERELQNVRYEIERNTTTLRRLSNLVNYVTVTINLREVIIIDETEGDPETLWSQIKRNFKASVRTVNRMLKDALVWIISTIPFLIIILPLALICILIIKRNKRRRFKANKPSGEEKE